MTNVYLLLLAGSLFNALQKAISDPASIISLAGAALPSVSVFFINVIINQLLLGIPLMLLRIAPLLIINLYKGCFGERKLSIRQIVSGPLNAVSLDYGAAIPSVLYVVVVTLLYWVISPILLAISALLFISLYGVYKYQFVYVYVPYFETGGRFWYGLYGYTMAALMGSSIAILGYMAIKQGPAQTPLLFPLPAVVLLAWRYTEGQFKVRADNYAMTLAEARDKEGAPVDEFDAKFFHQPALSRAEMDPLPYRLQGTPLFDEEGNLSWVYVNVMSSYRQGRVGCDPRIELAEGEEEEEDRHVVVSLRASDASDIGGGGSSFSAELDQLRGEA